MLAASMVTVYTGSKGLDYVCTIATVTLESSQDLDFYMHAYNMHVSLSRHWDGPPLRLMHNTEKLGTALHGGNAKPISLCIHIHNKNNLKEGSTENIIHISSSQPLHNTPTCIHIIYIYIHTCCIKTLGAQT